jgi:hypothetical protein
MLFPARAEVIGGAHSMAGSRIEVYFGPEQVIHHVAYSATFRVHPAVARKRKFSPLAVSGELHGD